MKGAFASVSRNKLDPPTHIEENQSPIWKHFIAVVLAVNLKRGCLKGCGP